MEEADTQQVAVAVDNADVAVTDIQILAADID